MFTRRLILAFPLLIALAACSTTHVKQSKVYQAGEKAEYNGLTYSVVDVQILPNLGDPANPRIPQNRFVVVQLSVSSSGNQPVNIPATYLVDDAGKVYPELADGAGVPKWLGVLRNVEPAQTESGHIVFDAPAAHYKLRLTDDGDEDDVFVDIPLNFVHEQMNGTVVAPPDATPRP